MTPATKMILDFTEMHIHPSIIHFPIALILAGYMIYCISVFRKRDSRKFAMFSYYVLLAAALSAFVASFAGIFYTHSWGYKGEILEALDVHKFWAMSATLLICITAIIKVMAYFCTKRGILSFNWSTFVFYTLSAFCVIMATIKGTVLVWNHLAGPEFIR